MNNIETIKEKLQEAKQSVETLSIQIEVLEEQLKQAETENKKFKRVEENTRYYSVNSGGGGCFNVNCNIENYTIVDSKYFSNNNYFLTKERAQEVTDKINFLMRLERLHDELCPDYTPNWKSNDAKHYICYDIVNNVYTYSYAITWKLDDTVYFPTAKIAQKVCDILNNELKK